jgi:hypothetical protein
MLTVLGVLADLGVVAGLVLIGRWLGANGAPREVAALVRKVAALMAPLRSPWIWLSLAVVTFWLPAAGGRRVLATRHLRSQGAL